MPPQLMSLVTYYGTLLVLLLAFGQAIRCTTLFKTAGVKNPLFRFGAFILCSVHPSFCVLSLSLVRSG